MKYNPRHALVKAVKSLSPRGRIVAAVAALAVAGGGGAVMAAGAGAATANCQSKCITFSSQAFGTGYVLNANNKTNERLRNLSDTYTNEDFVIDTAHPVLWYVLNGIISKGSFAAVNYPNYEAIQIESAPNGTNNNECVGLGSPAYNGEGVTKEPWVLAVRRPCGSSTASTAALVVTAWPRTLRPSTAR